MAMYPTEWTSEQTLHFIELYKSKHVLWNSKNPDYYNKMLKTEAWKQVARAMGLSPEECKRRMTSLLSYLRREKSKIRKGMETGEGKFCYSNLF